METESQTMDEGAEGIPPTTPEGSEGTKEKIPKYERKVGNWLRGYLEYSKESESPESYHLWCAFHAMATVIRRNVHVDQGMYILFPNLYVGFIGPPARTAKSTAMWMERQILHNVPGVVFAADSTSREDLITQMENSKFGNVCALAIHNSELSDLIGTSGLNMIQFLTSIYDGNYAPPKGWQYSTKHQGKNLIVNPCLNMIFGTTPTYFAEAMPDNIVGHGFTSRVVVVYEDEERHRNPRPEASDPELMKALTDDLRHISHIRGKFSWGTDVVDLDKYGRPRSAAQKYYDDYYESLYERPPEDYRLEGFHWRKKSHLLKMAMICSLAERDDLTLQVRDFEAAISFLQDIEPRMVRAFSAVGKFEHATTLERIGTKIAAAGPGGISINDIYRGNYYAADNTKLQDLLSTLVRMGVAKREFVNNLEVFKTANGEALPWAKKRVD